MMQMAMATATITLSRRRFRLSAQAAGVSVTVTHTAKDNSNDRDQARHDTYLTRSMTRDMPGMRVAMDMTLELESPNMARCDFKASFAPMAWLMMSSAARCEPPMADLSRSSWSVWLEPPPSAIPPLT